MMPKESFLTPFDCLSRIEQTLLARAHLIPMPQEPVRDWGGIFFQIQDQIFITAMTEVVEILRVRHLAAIPNVKVWLRGLIPYRGEVYPVTDLMAFLTNKLTKITEKARILVTKQQGEYFGFLVDEIIGIEYFAKENHIQPKILPILLYEPYLGATLVKDNKEYPIISLKALVEHPLFRDVTLRTKVISDVEE